MMEKEKNLGIIRWGSLFIFTEICLVFLLLRNPGEVPGSSSNTVFFFLIPTVTIAVFSLISFVLSFLKDKIAIKILRSIYEDKKWPLILYLVLIGVLAACSIIYFVLADTVEIPVYHYLMPFAVLGFALSWEILILLSFTRKEWREKPKYWIGLPLLLAANYFLWHKLVNAGRYLQPFLPNVYPDETIKVFSTYKWWQLLLPIKEFKQTWPFGLVLTYFFENRIGTAGVWYVYQAILMLTAFFLSWKVFRSPIFSYVLAICLGFGTHHYHAFQYSGITGFYLLHALFLLLLYFSYAFIRGKGKYYWYLAAIIPILLLTAIYYEGWLDFFAAMWLMAVFLFFYFKHKKQTHYSKNLLILFILFNAVFLVYILIKFTYTSFAHTSGESALVVFYGKEFFWRGIEDLVSNYFTNLYVTLTNFLPPAFITSNSLYHYSDLLEQKAPFTYHHYVFYWRYFAGAGAALFYVFLFKTLKKTWDEKAFSRSFPLLLFAIMVAVNGATHTIIQFLPMRSMPVFGYYVEQGVLGFSLLLAYLLHMFNLNTEDKKMVTIVVALVVTTILWSSLRRPHYLWHMIEVVNLDHQGPYPNPLNVLFITIRRIFPGFL